MLVISDSLGAIQRAANMEVRNLDCITASVKKLMFDCRQNRSVAFFWVPSHQGVKGNQTADKLATIGRDLSIPYENNVDKSDKFNMLRGKLI